MGTRWFAAVSAVSLVWCMCLLPLALTASDYLEHGVSWDPVEIMALAGLLTLLGAVTALIACLNSGRARLAARLYVVPSLIWQGSALATGILVLAFS